MIGRLGGLLGVLAGVVSISSAASAQSSNWYVSGSAGALFINDYSANATFVNGLGQTAAGTNTRTFNPGEARGASLGYRLPYGFRAEAEFSYLHFSANSIAPRSSAPAFANLNGTTLTDPSGGDHNRYAVTANLFYDLPFKPLGITPYIGAGAGYYHGTATDAVYTRSNGARFTEIGSSGGNGLILAEVGAAIPLVSKLALVPAYRYEYFFGSALHNANIVKLGLRYSF